LAEIRNLQALSERVQDAEAMNYRLAFKVSARDGQILAGDYVWQRCVGFAGTRMGDRPAEKDGAAVCGECRAGQEY
jgi:hypothetical protein